MEAPNHIDLNAIYVETKENIFQSIIYIFFILTHFILSNSKLVSLAHVKFYTVLRKLSYSNFSRSGYNNIHPLI